MQRSQRKKRAPTGETSKQRLWGISKFVAGIVAGGIGTAASFIAVQQWTQKPDIHLAWHSESVEQYLVLSKDAAVTITYDDLLDKTIHVPIRLALQNTGSKTARSVRLEIAYPDHLTVNSEASRSIREDGPLRVYRHDLGDLIPARSFTPLRQVDVVNIPVEVTADRFNAVLQDGIPIHVFTILTFPKVEDIVLGVSLYSESTEPADMTLTIKVPKVAPHVRFLEGNAKGEFSPASSEDLSAVAGAIGRPCSKGEWSETVSPGGLVSYCGLETPGGVGLQLLSVDDVLRRAIVDSDLDGYVDFELWDVDQDDTLEQRIDWNQKVPATEWTTSDG